MLRDYFMSGGASVWDRGTAALLASKNLTVLAREHVPGPAGMNCGGGVVPGSAILIAAFAVIGKLAGWANDYGTILVYLAFFLWMSISGRLFWWGADKLIALLRTKKSDNRGAHR